MKKQPSWGKGGQYIAAQLLGALMGALIAVRAKHA